MNDLISRTWLLAEYDKRHKGPPGGARKLIEEAPSALGTNLAEVGTDAISRAQAIDVADGYMERLRIHIGTPNDTESYAYARGLLVGLTRNINELPSAQPEQERRQGRDVYGRLKVGQWRFEVTDVKYEDIVDDDITVPHITKASITGFDYKGSWFTEDVVCKSAQPEPHWIPCSERLPETTGEYLVTKREMYTYRLIVDIAVYFVNDGWHKADPVIAWMPLPEPYKGVTE